MNHYTRFRAYQLPNKGSSFSLRVDNHFTLMEARYNDLNKEHIKWELDLLKRSDIDALHITSWDDDHCNYGELCHILRELKPKWIEFPSEVPTTINGLRAKVAIERYNRENPNVQIMPVTPKVVRDGTREPNKGQDIFYNPIINGDKSNDNSVVTLFRVGSFTVLSLGDCEDAYIAQRLMRDKILQAEVDIMILAHHGADNGFTTTEFLRTINPSVCVCSANYANEYEHPKQVIRNRSSSLNIPLLTTKRGDIIAQTDDARHFKVANYVSNNETRDSVYRFENKTYYTN